MNATRHRCPRTGRELGEEKAEGSQGPEPNRVGGTPNCSAESAGEARETLRALLFYFSVKTVNVILYLK